LHRGALADFFQYFFSHSKRKNPPKALVTREKNACDISTIFCHGYMMANQGMLCHEGLELVAQMSINEHSCIPLLSNTVILSCLIIVRGKSFFIIFIMDFSTLMLVIY